MGMTLTSLGLKFITAWAVLLLAGHLVGPTPGQSAVISIILAVVSWVADRMLPFSLQGVTRWAIDGGLATLTIYVAQFLWPGPGITLLSAIIAGYVIGAVEIPLHFYLVGRFGLAKKQDDRDGIH